MQDDDLPTSCSAGAPYDPARLAERLAALAREARLLEFALDATNDGAQRLGASLEAALEDAMAADSADELTQAACAIEAVLGEILDEGMQLSAEMSDMEVDGILGRSRMPVLTAVLSDPSRA